jgi:hypothetical protein
MMDLPVLESIMLNPKNFPQSLLSAHVVGQKLSDYCVPATGVHCLSGDPAIISSGEGRKFG